MKLSVIHSGLFKLDGGAMFGVVPKSLWSKLTSPDENNMCTWSMRCLLIEVGERKILVDTGLGNKQDAKFRSHFHPHGPYDLVTSLGQKGLSPSEITDVFLTHFHFDHVGGAVTHSESGDLIPQFPNATYWTNEAHYNWALHPNPRERASFLSENFVPLREAGVLNFLPIKEDELIPWYDNIQIQACYGHTEAMMVLHIPFRDSKLIYCADLLPSTFHIGLPYVMSYDVRPLVTLREKESLLTQAVDNNWYLFLEHDPISEVCQVHRNDKGRIVLKDTMTLTES